LIIFITIFFFNNQCQKFNEQSIKIQRPLQSLLKKFKWHIFRQIYKKNEQSAVAALTTINEQGLYVEIEYHTLGHPG